MLSPRAAGSCPVKVQNEYDPNTPLPGEDVEDPGRADPKMLEMIRKNAQEFKTAVLDVLALQKDIADLRNLTMTNHALRLQATKLAAESGQQIIISPELPYDEEDHRMGSPDMLVRCVDQEDGKPRYAPAIVRNHRVLERNDNPRPTRINYLSEPGFKNIVLAPGAQFRYNREADLLELAHYWRMMEKLGWAGLPVGGVVGSDRFVEKGGSLRLQGNHSWTTMNGLVISWASLDTQKIRTFSRRPYPRFRYHTALSRYEHEFNFRTKVAKSAMTGKRMVSPIVIEECETCRWWPVCAQQLPKADLSLRIEKAPLDAREVSTLRALGINTIEDLANASEVVLRDEYLPNVQHRPHPDERLRRARKRAKMMMTGVELERTSEGPIELPHSRYELDLDIESNIEDKIYLWGILVTDRKAPEPQSHYVSFASFENMTDASEAKLAAEALTWLYDFLMAHPGSFVYHYSDYERTHIKRVAKRIDDPKVKKLVRIMRNRFFDLFAVMSKNFFGAHGLGLKAVATGSVGFHWRDESPSGLNSQSWFDMAVSAADVKTREHYRVRLLEYNEDDTRATLALRDWLNENYGDSYEVEAGKAKQPEA